LLPVTLHHIRFKITPIGRLARALITEKSTKMICLKMR
jgi:hypothetical protein